MKIGVSFQLLEEFFNELGSRGLAFPKFYNSNEIIIYSDYSGERKHDRFYSYSFYVIDAMASFNACAEILKLRSQEPEWGDKSFIEYKKLRKDKVRRRLLLPFLQTFDPFEGLILTVLIERKAPDFFMQVSDESVRLIEALGLGSWKAEVLRKSSNILYILTFLVRCFLNKDRALTWYSDRDDIFGANQSQRSKTLDIFSNFLLACEADIKGNNFRYVSDKHSLLNSDFLSLADLSAGAVLDYYQNFQQENATKDWTKLIIDWMSVNSTNLKKVMIVGKEEGGNKQLISVTDQFR